MKLRFSELRDLTRQIQPVTRMKCLFLLPVIYSVLMGFDLASAAVYGICVIVAICYFQSQLNGKNEEKKDPSPPPLIVESNDEKLNMLSSQINPHFLYNTLESIRGKALADGAVEVSEMTECLSSFFRYCISRKTNIVHLRDELNNIQEYMKIQQFRFDNRFSMGIQIDGSSKLMDYMIPKLTLQPLVENSIVHGLEVRAGNGNIVIRIQETDRMVLVYVEDDGVGIEENRLETINRILHKNENDVANPADIGIALYNINARMKLLYGPEYGLHIYSTRNVGTTVEVRFPCLQPNQ